MKKSREERRSESKGHERTRSSTDGGETATEIEIATERGTSVAGEWTMTRAVTIPAVIEMRCSRIGANLTEMLLITEILGIEVEVDREISIIERKIAIVVTVEIKEIVIIEVLAIIVVAGTAREAEVTSNFS